MAEQGFFKGKLKEAYMKISPVSVAMYSMPIGDAMDILNTMDMETRPKLLEFLGRFTEEQIATHGWASYMYARYVKLSRFKLGEQAIRGNWKGVGGYEAASEQWRRYQNWLLSRPPYVGPKGLTEEGHALRYEFERMDLQPINPD